MIWQLTSNYNIITLNSIFSKFSCIRKIQNKRDTISKNTVSLRQHRYILIMVKSNRDESCGMSFKPKNYSPAFIAAKHSLQ